jgi:hypothetical protein
LPCLHSGLFVFFLSGGYNCRWHFAQHSDWVLSGCYLTRLATDIPQHRRGLVFGGAYAFGSNGTWLISLPMGGRFLWHGGSFFAIATLAAGVHGFFVRLSAPPQRNRAAVYAPDSVRKFFGLPQRAVSAVDGKHAWFFHSRYGSGGQHIYIEFTRA